MRKSNIQPATAYDYRRYIELVQILALPPDECYKAVEKLCDAWGVPTEILSSDDIWILTWLRRLAGTAIDYHRNESSYEIMEGR